MSESDNLRRDLIFFLFGMLVGFMAFMVMGSAKATGCQTEQTLLLDQPRLH